MKNCRLIRNPLPSPPAGLTLDPHSAVRPYCRTLNIMSVTATPRESAAPAEERVMAKVDDISPERLLLLNRGEVEARSLTECLAVDFAELLCSAFPQIGESGIGPGWQFAPCLPPISRMQSTGLRRGPRNLPSVSAVSPARRRVRVGSAAWGLVRPYSGTEAQAGNRPSHPLSLAC